MYCALTQGHVLGKMESKKVTLQPDFKCICGLTFTGDDWRTRNGHLLNDHGFVLRFRCPGVGCEYEVGSNRLRDLRGHMVRMHPGSKMEPQPVTVDATSPRARRRSSRPSRSSTRSASPSPVSSPEKAAPASTAAAGHGDVRPKVTVVDRPQVDRRKSTVIRRVAARSPSRSSTSRSATPPPHPGTTSPRAGTSTAPSPPPQRRTSLEDVRDFLASCTPEERREVHELSRPPKEGTATAKEVQARVNPSVTITEDRGLVVVAGAVTVSLQGPVDLPDH